MLPRALLVAGRRLILIPAVFLIVACGSAAEGEQAATRATPTTTTTTIDPAVQIECSNVTRAYNAWHWTPASSADWALFQVQMRMDDGDAFHDAIVGYTDEAALDLVVAVAEYNYELAFVQANMTISGRADTSNAETTRGGVEDAYAAFLAMTCK